jgi:protein-export membrane protein SecD
LSVILTARGEADEGVLDKTVEVIRERIDSIGAQEPDIARSGADTIIVQLPGITDFERARQIIGRTAQLRFRPVLETISIANARSAARREGHREGSAEYQTYVETFMKDNHGWELTRGDPADREVNFAGKDDTWYRLSAAQVYGDMISDAFAQFPPDGSGGWSVELKLTSEGTAGFAQVTEALAPQGSNPGRALAIVLDNLVESAPVVQQPITDGQAQISGTFSQQEAEDLALVLRTGALPIELEESQVQQVSATLGTASLRAGLLAGAIGIALVALYMLFFYRLLGLVTIIGLGLFGALVMGLIGYLGRWQGFTLTLAGVAGLIVSVGIAADSYIIYYERVKDELKEGKTFRSAAERGFRSAWRTNVAANSVAFAAAIILYLLAVGPVRGFALTLGISVLIDLFLLRFYTHPFVSIISRNRRLAGLRGVGMREAASAAPGGAPRVPVGGGGS